MLIAGLVAGLFFPQRIALGFDARESTPGFKRQLIILAAETRSFKRAVIVTRDVLGWQVDDNTIERLCLDAGAELAAAKESDWKTVLTGEVPVPEVAIVEFDGGRIRTRKMDCGPGVHLAGKGWNETKNAIFVSATSTTSASDPQPNPPECFLDREHVAKLVVQAKHPEKCERNENPNACEQAEQEAEAKQTKPTHKPQRMLRTVLSSMQKSSKFGQQMLREAKRRKFFESSRKAFVADGLPCNWKIQQTHFRDFTPVLDFTHAVTYIFEATVVCFGKSDEAWTTYTRWMTAAWQGRVGEVIGELKLHQERIGSPPPTATDDDPQEKLRCIIQYIENNCTRMRYEFYRCQGLPTTSAWVESAVKEVNYRVKGTEMFWNYGEDGEGGRNAAGAEAILQIRSAGLCDDARLARFLTHRPGQAHVRRSSHFTHAI